MVEQKWETKWEFNWWIAKIKSLDELAGGCLTSPPTSYWNVICPLCQDFDWGTADSPTGAYCSPPSCILKDKVKTDEDCCSLWTDYCRKRDDKTIVLPMYL